MTWPRCASGTASWFWYRWPNSRGRIVCNGCHWLDYFLFLNGFTQVADLRVHRARNGDVHVAVDLENDASLSLTITEIGSHRLNVRDHIRLSAGSRNAWIVDQCRYESESPSRLLRRAKTSRADSFHRMYDDIAGRLVSGEAGDTVTSLESSGGLTLAAQELLDGQEV